MCVCSHAMHLYVLAYGRACVHIVFIFVYVCVCIHGSILGFNPTSLITSK